jgi:hypothetical protein
MGTNTESIRNDPLYIGLRRPRATLQEVSAKLLPPYSCVPPSLYPLEQNLPFLEHKFPLE